MVLQILTYTHHTTTMLFGIFLSAFFLGVKQDKKNILQLLSLAVVSGILYVLCVLLFGTETVDQIYPLIVHAPLLFVLVLHYKFRILPSLISIFTAYLCCQCSNWMAGMSVRRQQCCLPRQTGNFLLSEVCPWYIIFLIMPPRNFPVCCIREIRRFRNSWGLPCV